MRCFCIRMEALNLTLSELNHPFAVLQQDDFSPICSDAGDSHIFTANHELHVDDRVVHAQLAVFFFAAFSRAFEVFAVGCA